MGQVINFRALRQRRPQAQPKVLCCPRCGADLWRIQGDGQIFCGDCEQACPLHNSLKSNT